VDLAAAPCCRLGLFCSASGHGPKGDNLISLDEPFDVAMAGAGILGLAHAYHLARRGKRVLVVERHPRAQGASVRNFGMLWPIGQPAGPLCDLARRSLEIWHEVLPGAGLWHERSGSLHLAYHDDEAQVLGEFLSSHRDCGYAWLDAGKITAHWPAVNAVDLKGGLWSPIETCVDPREVVAKLPGWLTASWGVRFVFGCQALAYERPVLHTSLGEYKADAFVVCGGDEFQTLYPAAFVGSGLTKCKLQMLRSEPMAQPWRLGPMLAAGLTLRHYRAFASCKTLPDLCRRLDAELPEYHRYGIHVMAAQNGQGELTLGDSHEYGDPVDPFNKEQIDGLILAYLATFLKAPGLRIAQRWFGSYAKHAAEPFVVLAPKPGVTIVTGVGGAGMTLSFGLAEMIVRQTVG
jgi:FAD dependent oxidoreductase TIGR03364